MAAFDKRSTEAKLLYNLGNGINRTDHPMSDIETRTEALAFHGFTETIRGNIPPDWLIIRSVVYKMSDI